MKKSMCTYKHKTINQLCLTSLSFGFFMCSEEERALSQPSRTPSCTGSSHSFNKHSWNAYYRPGTGLVLGTAHSEKNIERSLLPRSLYSWG